MSHSYRYYETAEGSVDPNELTLSALMAKAPKTLGPTQPVRQALRLMQTHNMRHVPVVGTDERLVGLVTETDILQKVIHGQHLTSSETYHASMELMLPVEKVMTADVHTLGPDAPVAQAVKLFIEHRIRCVPVVDADKRLLGILTETDLMQLLAHMLD